MNGEQLTYEELGNMVQGKEYNHTEYCHYTKLGVIDDIIKNKRIWFGCVEGFNDDLDKRQFGKDEIGLKYYYGLCFSTGVNENLPLWYMYSGTDGKGGCIVLKNTQVKNLVNKSTYELWELEEDEKKLKEKIMSLENGKTMHKVIKDVLYYQDKGNRTDIKYNGKVIHNFRKENFKEIAEEKKGFCKGLIWYYEKETRILIELIGKARDIVEKNKKYVIVANFKTAIHDRYITIRLAPEIESFEEACDGKHGIKMFLENNSKVSFSKHRGELKMNLCDRCRREGKK